MNKEKDESSQKIDELFSLEEIKMDEARIMERNRISEDLHDGVLGKLFATRIRLGFLGMKLFNDFPDKKREFDTLIKDIECIEKEIREISHNLNNDILPESKSFNYIIHDLVKESEDITKIKFLLKIHKSVSWEFFENKDLINIYRVLQEAIQNIIKHSEADNAFITITQTKNEIKIILSDNGKGFIGNGYSGIGLNNMRNRINNLGGKLDIQFNNRTYIVMIIPNH